MSNRRRLLACLDMLEARTLLSAVVLEGTSSAETYTVDYNATTSKITVQLGSNTPTSYDAWAVDSLTINSAGGNDTIIVNRSHGNLFFSGVLVVDGGTGMDAIQLTGPGANTITAASYAPTDELAGCVRGSGVA